MDCVGGNRDDYALVPWGPDYRYERVSAPYRARRADCEWHVPDDALARFEHQCVVTGIGAPAVLDITHVLSRSEYPELVEDDENVLVLNALHHRAFDADLFTLTDTQQLRVNPVFSPGHPLLQETIVARDGDELLLPPEATLHADYLAQRNESLAWV